MNGSAARKLLEMAAIADVCNVSLDWLATGRVAGAAPDPHRARIGKLGLHLPC